MIEIYLPLSKQSSSTNNSRFFSELKSPDLNEIKEIYDEIRRMSWIKNAIWHFYGFIISMSHSKNVIHAIRDATRCHVSTKKIKNAICHTIRLYIKRNYKNSIYCIYIYIQNNE